MISFFACLFMSDKSSEIQADTLDSPVANLDLKDEVTVVPKHEPTDDVKKFLGIWLTSGYNLQPNANTYVVENNTTKLYTDQSRSFATFLLTATSWAHYQWYESSDGKTWSEVKEKTAGIKRILL